jgi:N-acetylglucosamine-6-phosphate deacetylase
LCSIEEAITLATIAPRRAIGQSIDLVGQPLDRLLVWSVDRQQQIQSWRRLA